MHDGGTTRAERVKRVRHTLSQEVRNGGGFAPRSLWILGRNTGVDPVELIVTTDSFALRFRVCDGLHVMGFRPGSARAIQ